MAVLLAALMATVVTYCLARAFVPALHDPAHARDVDLWHVVMGAGMVAMLLVTLTRTAAALALVVFVVGLALVGRPARDVPAPALGVPPPRGGLRGHGGDAAADGHRRRRRRRASDHHHVHAAAGAGVTAVVPPTALLVAAARRGRRRPAGPAGGLAAPVRGPPGSACRVP